MTRNLTFAVAEGFQNDKIQSSIRAGDFRKKMKIRAADFTNPYPTLFRFDPTDFCCAPAIIPAIRSRSVSSVFSESLSSLKFFWTGFCGRTTQQKSGNLRDQNRPYARARRLQKSPTFAVLGPSKSSVAHRRPFRKRGTRNRHRCRVY